MLFHWLRDYGKGRSGATAVVDGIFAAAKEASPDVFGADSRQEPAQQAKFEHMCPWVAFMLLDKDGKEAQAVLEALVDRIEVGLREGGVGDMKVGVQMRKYAAALHGRMRRYAQLLDKRDWDGLKSALGEHGVGEGVVIAMKKAAKKPTNDLRKNAK